MAGERVHAADGATVSPYAAAMNAMTQRPISLPEADRAAAASREVPRGGAPTVSATAVRLPDWVFIPAAPSPADATAPKPFVIADSARRSAELLVLPSQAPPYASAVLTEPPPVPPRLPVAGERPARRLDKHGIDLALSMGRQAVERAKLSGIDRLICHAPSPAFAAATAASVTDALAAACPVVMALVGACLAASQIGVRAGLSGAAAQQALHLALAINPDAARWVSAGGAAEFRAPAATAKSGAAPAKNASPSDEKGTERNEKKPRPAVAPMREPFSAIRRVTPSTPDLPLSRGAE